MLGRAVRVSVTLSMVLGSQEEGQPRLGSGTAFRGEEKREGEERGATGIFSVGLGVYEGRRAEAR